jgi:hypothetical protein
MATIAAASGALTPAATRRPEAVMITLADPL